MNRLIFKRYLFLLGVFAVMIFIFMMSSETSAESSKSSQTVIEKIAQIVVPDFKNLEPSEKSRIVDTYQHLVRKTAHFSIYLLLGFMFSGFYDTVFIKSKTVLAVSLFSSALYASSDEFHQLFVAGRGPQVTDVLLDSFGAFFGIMIYMLLLITVRRIKNARRKKQ